MHDPAKSGTQASLTRSEVAHHLGVSITTVRRMEGHQLHPSTDARGVHVFERAEVLVILEKRAQKPVTKRENPGEVAARVFELFKAGADLRKVVMAARVHPHVVRELYAEWLVTLVEGENRRRIALANAEDRRERARMERDQRRWDQGLGR